MKYGIIWFVAFIATIFGANWALETYGIVNVGFGLTAPAGVLFAGIAFTVRDLLHEARGRWWVISAIAIGGACSYLVSPSFAAASALAFMMSEGADLAVYEPIRKRHWLGAVALSNSVGIVVDSALFLWLAFGSLDYLTGQIVAKGYMTALAVLVLWIARNHLPVGVRVLRSAA